MVKRKQPEFWATGATGPWLTLLRPAAGLYQLGAGLRTRLSTAVRFEKPVLCIGNVTVGGGGKTPLTRLLAAAARELGLAVAIASKGYGGALVGPHRIDPARDTARDVGDEALMMARVAPDLPVYVAQDRRAGIQAAIAGGADLVLMDDGFQNPTVAPSAAILVIDGGFGFGNGLTVPAGPLREPVAEALRRADAVILIGEAAPAVLSALDGTNRLIRAEAETLPPPGLDRNRPIVAFAGLARPEKFFDGLKRAGLALRETRAFPDHHSFSDSDLSGLADLAAQADSALVTTEKDYIRLSEAQRSRIGVLSAGYRLTLSAPWTARRILEELVLNG